MIKSIDRCGRASVTFTLPAAVRATRVAICGEWNGWSAERDVMERVGDVFSLTIVLQPGRAYRFRYLLDGARWENDWDADAYVPNSFGTDDSVVDLTALDAAWSYRPVQRRPKTRPPATEREKGIEHRAGGETRGTARVGHSRPERPGARGHGQGAARRAPRRHLYDTADLRLARSGITVRHRGGESGPPGR